MSFPIFIDANLPIYATGRPHPLKAPALRVLALAAEHRDAFVSSTEVVQELLHRYIALRSWETRRPAVEHFLALMEGRLEPVLVPDLEEAMRLADAHRDVAARDLVHAAVMQRIGMTRIVSADRDFDRIVGIERLDPATVTSWEGTIRA